MSFSQEVKDELLDQYGQARHCRLSELAVLIRTFGFVIVSEGGSPGLLFKTEHEGIARKYFTLLKKTFNIETVVDVETAKNSIYSVFIEEQQEVLRILMAVKMMPQPIEKGIDKEAEINPMLLKTLCCKRAFLRSAYLCSGSMSDPVKGYHLEFVCNALAQAEQIQSIIQDFELEAKVVIRKGRYVVYVKEGEAIVELLNVMEAHQSLMNLENTRILKEIKNQINRGVNCDAANIKRIAEAATKQREDILYLRDHGGFAGLSDGLLQVAMVRLENPYMSLQDIGAQLDPCVGKSGVNHRLRKLSEVANRLRLQGGEKNGSKENYNSFGGRA